MPLIRLLIIQNYPMRKQTLSQEFRQNNIKSLRKLVNYHSPNCINIHLIYLFSLEGMSHDCPLFYYSLFTIEIIIDVLYNKFVHTPILCTTPMLQYRESLILNNLKDISTTRTATCGAILLFSLFYSIEIKISWFCVFLQTYGTHEPCCCPINNVLFNRVRVATLFYAFISQSRE